ncbi:MAG: hypothetical protein QF538_06135 [Acidimicrobiales bacterium]|jgi:hypothetical protein|nr:hypothetical protein [Candidatus Thalassarchaeaceae archaeon]MDP7220378.1 hypothetical protein [Arenicellales bacterium]MDP7411338.1 hypothetical protein [Acidimicrobiales bacterium]|tara:strand:+ start:184 stop:318 length:135 start_codon:yes stop_codon:yes gene_type:complete
MSTVQDPKQHPGQEGGRPEGPPDVIDPSNDGLRQVVEGWMDDDD